MGNEAAVCTLIIAVSKPAAMHIVAIVNLFNVLELTVLTNVCRRKMWPTLNQLFFGDEGESENFTFSIDRHGANIPPIRPRRQSAFFPKPSTH